MIRGKKKFNLALGPGANMFHCVMIAGSEKARLFFWYISSTVMVLARGSERVSYFFKKQRDQK